MLPKLTHPVFPFTLPIKKTNLEMHPMTVREEKLCLFVDAEERQKSLVPNLIKVLNHCVETKGFDAAKLCETDFEYLVLQLRSISISNIIPISITLNQPVMKGKKPVYDVDGSPLTEAKKYEHKINIADYKLRNEKTASKDIDVGQGFKIRIVHPAIGDSFDAGEELYAKMIDLVYNEQNSFKFSDYTQKEQQEFVAQLSSKVSLEIAEFYAKRPEIYFEVDCDGTTVEVKGLVNFF